MGFVRTIIVFLLSLSVAAVPAAGVAAAAVQSLQITAAAPAPECCEHHGAPCDSNSKVPGECASMAACAAHCFNYADPIAGDIVFVAVPVTLQPNYRSEVVVSQIASPPFRPPRV